MDNEVTLELINQLKQINKNLEELIKRQEEIATEINGVAASNY